MFLERLPKVYDYMHKGKFIARVRNMDNGWFISGMSGFYTFDEMMEKVKCL